MKELGVAIVGPGWVAEEHIKGYHSHERCQVRTLVGMIPEDRARARRYIDKYDLKGCEYTEDYEAALEREDIDVVSVCTINSFHYPQARKALEADKHVFVEKPLVLDAEQLEDLCSLAEEKGKHTFVGHVARYYPAVVGVKNCIDQGLIGRTYYAESDYYHEIAPGWKSKKETAGSSLLMAGVHAVDMIYWLLGQREPEEVFAYSQRSSRRPDFTYDPTIATVVKFRDGTIGRFTSSLDCDMPYVFHLQVNGEDGAVRSNGVYSAKICQDAEGFMEIPATYPDDWDVAHHPFPEEIQDYVDGILGDEPRDLRFEKVRPIYEMVFAAQRSAERGKPVRVA